jgi:hypothetical protein
METNSFKIIERKETVREVQINYPLFLKNKATKSCFCLLENGEQWAVKDGEVARYKYYTEENVFKEHPEWFEIIEPYIFFDEYTRVSENIHTELEELSITLKSVKTNGNND